ncbi:protein mono-ADP-ribosyltransferase PARP12 [Amia ocellicauda]|uniref:protein mono-ADP-ribosyltransferase PARP12 n=1 Tax=Amia ocellicauda TaxID=2972642 RepID=UPI003463DC87
MAADCITSCATKILCSHGGALEYSYLRGYIQQLQIPDSVFCKILRSSGNFVIVSCGDNVPGYGLSPDSKVIAKTSVRLCKAYSTEGCRGCQDLHMCASFFNGKCKAAEARGACHYSHDLGSAHNLRVLSDNKLQNLNKAELFLLLLQNDSSLLPKICMHYNKGTGEFGNCSFKESCKKLHLCLHFLNGCCKFGPTCKRSHSIDRKTFRMLSEKGLGVLIQKLPLLYCNNYIINTQGTSKPEGKQDPEKQPDLNKQLDSTEICLFNIRNQCTFKDACINIHYSLPYKWEVFNGLFWEELPHMEHIEKAFCNPDNTTSDGTPAVDFVNMTRGSAKVRRLSTVSSVTKPAHFILTTVWAWYWRDERRVWKEYGKQLDTNQTSSVTSETIEKAFLADGNSILTFTAGKHEYTLTFKDMYQQNKAFQTQREVCRRPVFVSSKDVQRTVKGESSGTKSFPSHWDPAAVPECGYELVPVPRSSQEFKTIQNKFENTLKAVIHKIERIQNIRLWEAFEMQKQRMKLRNGGMDVEERFLFHGTTQSTLQAICEHNFDWRICGKNGTLYGKGSYFARDAKYSHHYTGSTPVRAMFVSRVLVGMFVRGETDYLLPPYKPGSTTSMYDSCVNDPGNPSIFVVFEKDQVYPEYLIYYTEVTTQQQTVPAPVASVRATQNSHHITAPTSPTSPTSSNDSKCTIL